MHQADESLGILDRTIEDHSHRLVPGHDQGLDLFAGLERHLAGGEVACQVQVHAFVENARRHGELAQLLDAGSAVAGFFDQFSFGGRGRVFARFQRASGKFNQSLVHRHAVVANQAHVVFVDQR